jgi:hypothetical protein
MVQHYRAVASGGLRPENGRCEGVTACGDTDFFLDERRTEARFIGEGRAGERRKKPDQSTDNPHCRFPRTGYFDDTA